MSFSKHLLSAVFLGSAIFAAATLPLATLGTKPVEIQLEGKPVFVGQFRDLSIPYLGLALTLGIGAGATHLAMMRWQQSARRLDRIESQMSNLKQQLTEKEALIEKLSFSPSRLQASGLDHFLSDDFVQSRQQPKHPPKRKKPPVLKQSGMRAELAHQNGHAQVAFRSGNT
ncbi:MAG: hypothetical protein MUF72_04020 [Elainella sp. Prado103]|jgi:hypothetical protein|nr:hypothetical protein [Elainella sp. Prado103]